MAQVEAPVPPGFRVVLDACSVIAFLGAEEGSAEVLAALSDCQCYLHSVNRCEVAYRVARMGGMAAAEAALRDLDRLSVEERPDLDREFCMEVIQIKSGPHRISLADACCLALSHRLNAVILTTDHGEFDPFAAQSPYRIRFVR